ncbi:hypothetical protein F5Y07DRAFT_150324 [Xylaria sp. FL0933]|nr:hypothetical protein F5Y07DRAFT_150324 [Xylaria sp. FL0933]
MQCQHMQHQVDLIPYLACLPLVIITKMLTSCDLFWAWSVLAPWCIRLLAICEPQLQTRDHIS